MCGAATSFASGLRAESIASRPASKRRALRLLLLAVVFLCCAATTQAFTITRTSSPVFYIDTSVNPQLRCMYVSYQITNNSATSYPDVWARLDTSGAVVTLATTEDGLFHIGPMSPGQTRTVFFYIAATSATLTAQTQTVRIFPTRPPATELFSASFTMTVAETIQANANKVTTTVAGPNPPGLGGLVTITVTGDTGTIGDAKILSFSPASFTNWPANVYELTSSSFAFSGGNNATVVDRLLVPQSVITSTSNTSYTLTYTFRTINANSAPASVAPFGFISSGTQVKHTTVDPVPISAPVNTLTLGKTASTARLSPGASATYTLSLTNSGAYDATVEDLVDTLPTTPGAVTYVVGSSAFNGAPLPDPFVSGSTLSWIGTFLVPAGQTRNLTFQVTFPASHGTYTNRAVAHIGSTQIDSTTSTSDNSPATTNVLVQAPPNINLCKTVAGQACPPPALSAQLPGTEVTYIINFTNDGGRAASSLIISDKIPVNTEFKLGSVVYNAGNTGLAAPVVEFTTQPRNADPTVEDPPSPWVVYAPPGAAGTYDPQITYVRFRFAAGNLAPGTSGSVSFTVRIR